MGWRATHRHAAVLEYLLAGLAAASGLHLHDPLQWYATLAEMVVFIWVAHFAVALCFEVGIRFVSSPPGVRVQTMKTAPPKYKEELIAVSKSVFFFACIVTWPVAQGRRGEATALKATLAEASLEPYPLLFYLVKLVFTVLFADMWTFWKHYLLPSPALYAFHKPHHTFHDPSCFASFAHHPVETLWTFCPILLMCFPQLSLYWPIHGTFLFSLGLLNFYMHCGYKVDFLERTLPKLWLDTSQWHNEHHRLSVANYGEFLIIWDYYLGTHAGLWDSARCEQQTKNVMAGKSSFEEQAAKQRVQ